MDDQGYEIALIEFDCQGTEPFTVIMDRLHEKGHRCYLEYDVDFSKRDGFAYHETGSGGMKNGEVFRVSGPYWIRDESVPVQHMVSPQGGHWVVNGEAVPFTPVRLLELPEPWNKTGRDRWGAWEIFADMIHADTEYCAECKDRFHTEDRYRLCPHIQWCDECAMFSNPNELSGPSLAADADHCCHCGQPFEDD